MLANVSLEEAWDSLLSQVIPLPCESVPLLQAIDRVSFLDLVTTRDLPPWPQASVDGYAVPGDLFGLHRDYIVRESLQRGDRPGSPLLPGQAASVVTGGPLPDGAGAVVPWEQAVLSGNRVVLPGEIVSGSNIKLRGEDFMAGELLARRGTRLGPGRIGVLAAMGKREVPVFRRPRVAILSLGRGVVPCQTLADGGLVWDSNGPLLASLVYRDGGQVIGVEVSGGEACAGIGDRLGDRLKELIPQSDLVLTIGGAASGSDDQALSALRGLGARMLFWGMRVKPGSHSGAAILDSRLVISLPGNPAACAVAYQLLASPALHALQGLDPYPQRFSAQCTGSFPKKGGPRRFLRGYVFYREDGWAVSLLPGQKSSMLRSLVEWNALVELPAGHTPLEAGAPVSVLLLSPIPLPKGEYDGELKITPSFVQSLSRLPVSL